MCHLLCVAFTLPSKLQEQAALPASTQFPFNPQIKDTHTGCSFSTCLLIQFLGATISRLENCALINILIVTPHTCPKLELLSYISDRLHVGAGCVLSSHMAGQLFSSKAWRTLSLLPFISLFLQGPGSLAYSFCPAIGPWLLY